MGMVVLRTINNLDIVDQGCHSHTGGCDYEAEQKKRKIWKLVLTGGPCGGKTTGQARISTFFENLGWKVYRVPETATVLLGGGVNFAELSERAQIEFQENLLRTMIQIENSFFALAEASERNCLVICDRGTMDASCFVTKKDWDEMLNRSHMDEVDIRDNRYNQVVHMVTAATGAEEYYTVEHHATRLETPLLWLQTDRRNTFKLI